MCSTSSSLTFCPVSRIMIFSSLTYVLARTLVLVLVLALGLAFSLGFPLCGTGRSAGDDGAEDALDVYVGHSHLASHLLRRSLGAVASGLGALDALVASTHHAGEADLHDVVVQLARNENALVERRHCCDD